MVTFFSRRGGTRLRKPTPSIRVGHVYLDVRRRTLYCLNETARQLIHEGVPLTRDDLQRRSLRTLEGEPVRMADLPLMRAWRERVPQEASFLFTNSDGMERHLTWNAAPLAPPDGNVQGVVASLTIAPFDPDWQHLAGLAHDLRTPLQALRLLMPLLENTPLLHPEARALLERLRASADRALLIGMDLLEWARGPTLGGRHVTHTWFALTPLLTALVGEHLIHAQRKAITFVTDLNAAEGLEIRADRVRFGRLLSNLITNAIRYTSQGEVRIRASWRRDDLGQNTALILSVEDTGCGISPEDQESIFQPFERGKAGRESDSDGSGLGLAIVDRLVEELGLTLEVFSEYGRGSKFEVLLSPDNLRSLVGSS
ncbi:MAG TPA: HAMP domain-containing sensor histidine kinase [Gemmataceae bacterium]|nr:HAMP domain-containing sensor histidine kinase [Gemmataceae bacterium]